MNDNKHKTPIITRLYIILTIIFIILSISFIGLFIVTSIGVFFIIISIYSANKVKHRSAIVLGAIGQIFIIYILLSYVLTPLEFDTSIPIWLAVGYFVAAITGLIICLLEICVINPLLFVYRKEEKSLKQKKEEERTQRKEKRKKRKEEREKRKEEREKRRRDLAKERARIQQEKMTKDQAIAYIKQISTVYDSIILKEISKKTNWKVWELTPLIETLIFNGELTAEISDDKLFFDREAFMAIKEASEVKNTEFDEFASNERARGEIEANTAPKEILPIKDKKGKLLKNVVSVDDIEKVLSVEELQEIQQTEAEIGVEEMRINCIVHKGPVEGINVYICPSCKTFYCVRCAKAVKKNGEKCWTCKSEFTL